MLPQIESPWGETIMWQITWFGKQCSWKLIMTLHNSVSSSNTLLTLGKVAISRMLVCPTCPSRTVWRRAPCESAAGINGHTHQFLLYTSIPPTLTSFCLFPCHDTGSLQLFTGSLQLSTGSLQLFTGSLQLSTGSLQLSTGSLQLSTGSLQLSTGSLQLSTGSRNTWRRREAKKFFSFSSAVPQPIHSQSSAVPQPIHSQSSAVPQPIHSQSSAVQLKYYCLLSEPSAFIESWTWHCWSWRTRLKTWHTRVYCMVFDTCIVWTLWTFCNILRWASC
jgi:hypothetical protein